MQVDWLIKNVTVIDGSGGPEFRGDVAITGDRIVDIAPALNVTAQQVIDGEGRVLAPGLSTFIPMTISTLFASRNICQRSARGSLR